MSSQCYGRLAKVSQKGKLHHISFGDRGKTKHRTFLEYRCTGTAEDGQRLCEDCRRKPATNLEQKNQFRLLHGCVDEAIPPWSQIFEGEWYQSKVKIVGLPSEEDMARAKKAQAEARQMEVTPISTEPKKRGRKKAVAPEPIPAPAPVVTPQPQPNATNTNTKGKRRTKKGVQNVIEQPLPKVKPAAIEDVTLLKDIDVVKIVVKPFSHNDTSYFRDVSKNKLYSVGQDKRPSHYVGRWNPETQMIDTEFPDSDAE